MTPQSSPTHSSLQGGWEESDPGVSHDVELRSCRPLDAIEAWVQMIFISQRHLIARHDHVEASDWRIGLGVIPLMPTHKSVHELRDAAGLCVLSPGAISAVSG
jgi:hypothetical protein